MNSNNFLYKHNKALVPLAKTLRKNMTKEEKHLWYDFLKNYPVKITRQKVIGNYIVDFYCASAKLVIEVDGSHHYNLDGLIKDDIKRANDIEKHGIKIIRVFNTDINKNFSKVCEDIIFYIEEGLKKP